MASTSNPFHEGERQAQARAGERALADKHAAILRGEIDPRARPFLAEQRVLAAAVADADGTPWASVLAGEPGMASTADGRGVALDLSRIARVAADPFWRLAAPGADIGLLAIDLSQRRRLRINGRVAGRSETSLRIEVLESYPNCPKYIEPREVSVVSADPAGAGGVGVAEGEALGDAQTSLVQRTDTVFVASRHPQRGADASHRGGPPGFVRVVDARTLEIPDYAGNGMYNTLGNLLVEPRVGLVFLDFAGGRLLQMTGRAEVRFDQRMAADLAAPRGAATTRAWRVEVERWLEAPLPIRAAVPG
jgi:predicted pyridoxine 5'-phosphate oxidase superfamily flavin-nucleotide-binding protein